MGSITKVFVYGKELGRNNLGYLENLFKSLKENGIETCIYKPYMDELPNDIIQKYRLDKNSCCQYEELKELNPDCAITLGGDGTILNAVTLIRDLDISILGINLGRLGFLASIEKTFIQEAIQQLKKNMFIIDSRTMIFVESNMPMFEETKFGLNDFTLHKRDTSAMITIHTYINGDYLNSYWADGIIVATPTGSTGYSLSCGGPIIFPNSGNFVITPVAPHNLTVRPLVISDNSVISFEIEGRSENFLCTLDSRFETITSKHQIAIRKCNFQIKLVQLQNMTFLKTIREKLIWGKDSRN